MRVLILSMDSFESKSNGATIKSVFSKFNPDELGLIYCNGIMNSTQLNCFQILESRLLLFKNRWGISNTQSSSLLTKQVDELSDNKKKIGNVRDLIKNSSFFRMCRNLVWKLRRVYRNNELLTWIKDFSPDVLFLVAGDTVFLNDLAIKISIKFDIPLYSYFVDDYYFRKQSCLLAGSIRRSIANVIKKSRRYYVISELMENDYAREFGRDGLILMKDIIEVPAVRQNVDDVIHVVYLGNVYWDRADTLLKLGEYLDKINSPNVKCVLEIYTNSEIHQEIFDRARSIQSIHFMQPVYGDKYIATLCNADVLLHVEGFSSSHITKAKYSISTKLNEYVSAGRPIVAIGDSCLASIQYAKSFALVCDNLSELSFSQIRALIDCKTVYSEYANRVIRFRTAHLHVASYSSQLYLQLCEKAY